MADKGDGTTVDGDKNLVAGRDIVISVQQQDPRLGKSHFAEIDTRYTRKVQADGKLLRGKAEVLFSAESLFTSLVRIGLGYDDAFEVTNRSVGVLADQKEDIDTPDWIPTSLDLRTAVMRVLSALGDDGEHNASQVDLWFAAYIRRYGNPVNQFLKVIDHDDHRDLDYAYIKKTILPHVLCRIIGMDRFDNPLKKYVAVFSGTTVDHMADAVIAYTNELNLYTIRYKTLINLLQDLILEPPHPWIVNKQTVKDIVTYNIERADAHFADVCDGAPLYRFEFSIRECFQHSCAAVLATYGAFLGVDAKYGLHELRRAMKYQHQNPELWNFCRIAKMTLDFKAIDRDIYDFSRLLDRINDLLASQSQSGRRKRLYDSAERLLNISKQLVNANG